MPIFEAQNPLRVLIPWGTGRAYAASGSGLLVMGQGCVTYVSGKETTGSAAAGFTIYDGGSANGQALIDYNLTSSQSTSEMWGMHWVQFVEGLYVANNSGSVAGSVVAWMNHDCAAYNGALYHMAHLAKLELELRLAQLEAAL